MENISSSSVVDSRTVGTDINNKFLSLGSAVMVRKFDPAIVVSGSWNEVWIGLRCRVNNKYNRSNFNIQKGWYDANNPAIGVCKYPGLVYGESGSIPFSNVSISHSMYVQLSTWTGVNYSSSFNRAITTSTGYVNVTGSKNNNGSFAQTATINFTDNPKYRDILMIRFVTGSSAIKWKMDTLYSSGSFNDISSSAILADFMESKTWSAAVTSASVFGLRTDSWTSELTANRAVNGYFDAAFVSWEARFETLEINDIVYKFI